MARERVAHRTEIRLSTEQAGANIEAFVRRGDRHYTTLYDSISRASVCRLRRLALDLANRGVAVRGGPIVDRSDNNTDIVIVLV